MPKSQMDMARRSCPLGAGDSSLSALRDSALEVPSRNHSEVRVSSDIVEGSWETLNESKLRHFASRISARKQRTTSPVILVDLQKLAVALNKLHTSEVVGVTADANGERDTKVFTEAKYRLQVLLASPSGEAVLESFFASHVCFHSCVANQEEHEKLLGLNGVKYVDAVEYPVSVEYNEESVDSQRLWEQYSSMHSDSTSAVELCNLVLSCSRTLQWKFAMLEEIYRLAQAEHLRKLEREELTDRVKELEALQNEIAGLNQEYKQDAAVADVVQSLNQARQEQNAMVKEMKLYHQLELSSLSVVDQILAMVLQRSLAVHDGSNFLDIHKHCRDAWRAEFGRLPFMEADLVEDSSETISQSGLGALRHAIPAQSSRTNDQNFSPDDWVENLFLHLDEDIAFKAVALVEEFERALRTGDSERSEEVAREIASLNLILLKSPIVFCVVKPEATSEEHVPV